MLLSKLWSSNCPCKCWPQNLKGKTISLVLLVTILIVDYFDLWSLKQYIDIIEITLASKCSIDIIWIIRVWIILNECPFLTSIMIGWWKIIRIKAGILWLAVIQSVVILLNHNYNIYSYPLSFHWDYSLARVLLLLSFNLINRIEFETRWQYSIQDSYLQWISEKHFRSGLFDFFLLSKIYNVMI